jgi:hypothetical protein
MGTLAAPILGVFLLGFFFPRVNSRVGSYCHVIPYISPCQTECPDRIFSRSYISTVGYDRCSSHSAPTAETNIAYINLSMFARQSQRHTDSTDSQVLWAPSAFPIKMIY